MTRETRGYNPSEAELKDYKEKGKEEIEGNITDEQKKLSDDREKLYNSGVKIEKVDKDLNGDISINLDVNGRKIRLYYTKEIGEDEAGHYSANVITKYGDENKITHLNTEVASKIFSKVKEQADKMDSYNLDNDLAEALSDNILEELKDLEG